MKWRSLEEAETGSDTRSLRDQLAERKTLIAKYVPADIQAVHDRVVADLGQKGITTRVLRAGVRAPEFTLEDPNGRPVASIELLAQHRLVVCFLRGRWCPFCVAQMEAMNYILPKLQAAGATLVGVSPQTVQQSSFMAEQHRLKFPLLSDRGNRVARQFGLVYQVPPDQKAVYRSAFVNLALANGDESWELPIPATFIIEPDGRVSYASAATDYTQRPEPADILNWLARAAGNSPEE